MSEAGLPIMKDVVNPALKKTGEAVVRLDHDPVETEAPRTNITTAMAGTRAGMQDADHAAAPDHTRTNNLPVLTEIARGTGEVVHAIKDPFVADEKKSSPS